MECFGYPLSGYEGTGERDAEEQSGGLDACLMWFGSVRCLLKYIFATDERRIPY